MNIFVLGTGMTKFGELWDSSPTDLAKEAIEQSLNTSCLIPKNIDALFIGNMLSGILNNQLNMSGIFAKELGVYVPALRIEGACASGGLALHSAVQSVLSGTYKTVMVLGVEKMTDHSAEDIAAALMAAGSEEERNAGATFAGMYALIAQAYMGKYSLKEKELAVVSVKNHFHGSLNPKAQFQKPITVDNVMTSSKVADPLKLLDCSPISDGAAAIVISSELPARWEDRPVKIVASTVGTDSISLHDRISFTSFSSVVQAADNAYKYSKISPADIDIAEVHDCFSIAEIIALEDLKFSKRGQAASDIIAGKYSLGKGKQIINSSGGLKACGHPVGATGIKQIIEITDQLRGKAGKRQVKGAKIGLTHNVGGSGSVAAIHILKIEE